MSDFIPIEPPPGGMPYAVPFLGFNIERVPTLAVDLFQLAEWSQNLEDVRSLLELITDEVMIPSVHENFLAGGRPPWEPLSEYTLAQKQGNSILIETGNLLDVATAQSTWVIDAAEGEGSVIVQDLPGAEYGFYHMTGTTYMPQRAFLDFQDEDLDKIDMVMGHWVDVQTLTSGFFE